MPARERANLRTVLSRPPDRRHRLGTGVLGAGHSHLEGIMNRLRVVPISIGVIGGLGGAVTSYLLGDYLAMTWALISAAWAFMVGVERLR
jgi:hypothetical protein